MVMKTQRRCRMLLGMASISIITGCANLDVDSINSKFNSVTDNIRATASGNSSGGQSSTTQSVDMVQAQAEADKICASHVVFTSDITSGIVVKRDGLGEIDSKRGFFSATKEITVNGVKWTNEYALASKDAKYAILVSSKAKWKRKEISALDLIEKCKNRDTNAVVKHLYDSGDVEQQETAKQVTQELANSNFGRFDDGRDIPGGGNLECRIVNGVNERTANVLQESKVTSRVIGFVLAGNGYQIIINEKSTKTEVGTVDSECPITGIYEMRFGEDKIEGDVSYEIEDTAQIAAYRKIYKDFVEKKKAEEKAKQAAAQEKSLHF